LLRTAAVGAAALALAFRPRFGADHHKLNVVITERGMIAAEKIHSISYCLNRTEIVLIFRFEKQISDGALKHVALF